MSASADIAAPAAARPAAGSLPLKLAAAGLLVSAVGFFIQTKTMAFSWLIGLSFWTAIALGMLFFIMIQHIFDAGWGVVIRRQAEHFVAAFPWLALAFLPLLAVTFFYDAGTLWKWMDPARVAADPIYQSKSSYLNTGFFVVRTALYFAVWVLLASKLRRHSFAQDTAAVVGHTVSNRKWSALGLPLGALTLTFAAIDWMKALDYHWFSTMYGVWYFATAMRAALAVLVLAVVYQQAKGPYQGILQKAHLHDLGKLMFAFTVFYAYVTFSQYFIIWNANVPEETYWYVLRELGPDGQHNQWWFVGMGLVFGHFLFPFLYLIHYPVKVNPRAISFGAIWVLVFVVVDLCYNILPSKKVVDQAGAYINPLTGAPVATGWDAVAVPFLGSHLLWAVAAIVGIGGLCLWAYQRSFASQKLIPVHDPRILESLHHHE